MTLASHKSPIDHRPSTAQCASGQDASGQGASGQGASGQDIGAKATRRNAIAALTLGAFWLGSALLGAAPAAAEATEAAAANCSAGAHKLGVSRTVELDTSGGKLYGVQQYKGNDFLKDKEVVLTFDDGPSRALTTKVLDALSKECTKATFFMVGRMAKAAPAMVLEVAKRGHTIGTHTWSHANLNKRSRRRGIRQVEKGFSAVSKALGKPTAPFFRFPYLADPKRMRDYMATRNIGIFSIGIDSKDYRTRSGDVVTRKVMRDLKRHGKGIILFHDIQKSTARAMPGLLRKLRREGYKVVHIAPKRRLQAVASFDASATEDVKDEKSEPTAKPRSDSSKRAKSRKAKRYARKQRRRARRAKSVAQKKTPASKPSSKANDWKKKFLGGS